MEALRKRLYALADESSRHRVFWAEYNWYRRYGARARHFDPVPATTGSEHMDISMDLPRENLELLFCLEADADRLARARKALRVEWEQLRSHRSDLAWTLGRFQVMDSWRTLARRRPPKTCSG